jgi:hypothetical protein
VVKTFTDGADAITSPECPLTAVELPYTVRSITGKVISAPSLRPIQLRWAVLVLSDQSSVSRLSSSRPA